MSSDQSTDLTGVERIKVMADYYASPIWLLYPNDVSEAPLNSLAISQQLRDDLQAWADRYDAKLNMETSDAKWPSDEARDKFFSDGHELAQRLANEIPTVPVSYVKDEHGNKVPISPKK